MAVSLVLGDSGEKKAATQPECVTAKKDGPAGLSEASEAVGRDGLDDEVIGHKQGTAAL